MSPGLQVVTRYTSYTHLDPLLTRCPCWPASTANQSGLVTLTFDFLTLKVVPESRATWVTSMPILFFLDLSVLDLGSMQPMYATDIRHTDRQMSDSQHHRLMRPPRGRPGIIINSANDHHTQPGLMKPSQNATGTNEVYNCNRLRFDGRSTAIRRLSKVIKVTVNMDATPIILGGPSI